MDKVTYRVIGFGGIGENRLAKEGFCVDTSRFAAHPHAELIGATDVDPGELHNLYRDDHTAVGRSGPPLAWFIRWARRNTV
jgi:hypothetical protein